MTTWLTGTGVLIRNNHKGVRQGGQEEKELRIDVA